MNLGLTFILLTLLSLCAVKMLVDICFSLKEIHA